MVHDSKVTLIKRYIIRIIGNVNNETHGCIWHAAPMSKLKEELEHHIEHCQMFSHHIMFIGALIAWIRHPSILFTFIIRRCNAFIISVIVVIRRPVIFTEHFLWLLITVGKIYIHGSQHVLLSKWAYFHIWAMIYSLEFCSSQPDKVVGRLEQISSHVATFWVLFCILEKSVWRWASLTLVSFLLYKVHVEFSTCNGQNLVAIPSHLDV